MHVRFLIVGQGLSGTWLAHYLLQAQQDILVVDNDWSGAASTLSSGIINPITGKYMTLTWRCNHLLPFARQAYQHAEQLLGSRFYFERTICWLLKHPHHYHDCTNLLAKPDVAAWVRTVTTQALDLPLQAFVGRAEITGADVHTAVFVAAYRQYLAQRQQLMSASFDATQMELLPNGLGVRWQGITADYVLFCEGYQTWQRNPFFGQLPFAPVKGERLLVSIPDLPPSEYLLKNGIFIVPLSDQQYWVGSNYVHWATDHQTTPQVRQLFESQLQATLSVPYRVLDHQAGIRPASLHRRPFVGMHPQYPQLGILNGLGTKGVSLSPYCAHQLTQHLLHQTPIDTELSIHSYF